MAKKLRILHLEDDNADIELIDRLLRDKGLDCEIQVTDTRDAYLAAIGNRAFDLILADYRLPAFDGLAALAIAREICPDTPFLFVTGAMGEDIAVDSLKQGATDYVMKTNLSRLAPAVNRALKECEERRERKKLEEQLRQAQKMEAIGHLAGGVAHDFNNILTGIMGYATITNMKIKEDGHLKPLLKQILDLVDKGSNLTHSLLAFSRKQVLDPKLIRINDIVVGMQKILERIIGEDIKIKVVTGSPDLIFKADKSDMEQVLMNLATNARDAMPNGGQLTVTAEEVEIDGRFIQAHQYGEAGKYVVISVADTGVGMDKKTKEHMFEPFFTTKAVGKGTGLGLAMVYGTIKQHNGFIDVQSEPGEGTTLKIYMPSANPGLMHTPERAKPPILSGTETVLLVEDDDAVREVSKALIEKQGYRVIEAKDGEDAIRLFTEHKNAVDLVVSDVIMPKRTGIDLRNELRKIKPDVKVLFISGYTADMLTQKGFIETGINFIPKPLNLDAFFQKIREILDGPVP